MLNNYIIQSVFEELNYTPTDSQKRLIELLANFIVYGDENSLFLLRGYAGTGKTTVISAFVNVLNKHDYSVVLLAPTGRAAKVFSNYSNKSAHTIHKIIYRQKLMDEIGGVFSLDFNKCKNTFFIVDEASMIANSSPDASFFGSGALLDDLMQYVYSQTSCRMILVGDTAQLPPVGLAISPALNTDVLEIDYQKEVIEFNLREVVRQSADSGILYNATLLRLKMAQGDFSIPKLDLDYPDIFSINGGELLEEIEQSYSKYDQSETCIVCRSNKRANAFNMGIRSQILYREENLTSGDMIMVVKNNYFWSENTDKMDFIANGDIACVKRIRKTYELYGFHFAELSIEFIDYNEELDVVVLLDTLTSESPSLTRDENTSLFREIEKDYLNERNKRKRYNKIKEDKFFNALQIKFSYAVTCHKAQGGQWDSVFVDQGWLNPDGINLEFFRWLYTAFTRAKKKLFLINFDKSFFE